MEVLLPLCCPTLTQSQSPTSQINEHVLHPELAEKDAREPQESFKSAARGDDRDDRDKDEDDGDNRNYSDEDEDGEGTCTVSSGKAWVSVILTSRLFMMHAILTSLPGEQSIQPCFFLL